MFWKKKKPKAGQTLEIDFDLDRRSHFRVELGQGAPVFFRMHQRKIKVLDLSAGGMSLDQPGLPAGRRIKGELLLDESLQPIPMILTIIRSKPQGPTSCGIEDISQKERELLHQYVLQRQKEQLEMQKSKMSGGAPGKVPQ